MREVKFRGQDYSTGEWVYGYYFEKPMRYGAYSMITPIDCEGYGEDEKIKPIHVKRESVGQFTGLLDKNGKEIYEGDFLSDGKGEDGIVWYVQPQFVCLVDGIFHAIAEGKIGMSRLEYSWVSGNEHEPSKPEPQIETLPQ